MREQDIVIKKFKVTNLGEVTITEGPSIQSVREDLQRMGILDKDTIVEEITTTEQMIVKPINKTQEDKVKAPVTKFFTLPGGHKVKEVDGVLFNLEWKDYTKRDFLARINCEDIKFPEDVNTLEVLDWVELKPEVNEEKED